MSAVIVVFPPAAGGNHLKNIIVSGCYHTDFSDVYTGKKKSVHAHVGRNLQREHVENAVTSQDKIHVLHGHFGEIMSFQKELDNIVDKKFVIISPETSTDRKILSSRQQSLGDASFIDDNYFDHEQVFLYECFMYHRYFSVPLDCIMNISITEMFTADLTPALDRLEFLLGIPIDRTKINNMHTTWLKANKRWAQ